MLRRERGARDDSDDDEVDNVWPDEVRKSIVEIAPRLVRAAKRAVGDHIRAKLHVQQATLQVDKLGPQDLVRKRKGIVRAHGRDAVEEDIDGDLQATIREVEEVLGCEEG